VTCDSKELLRMRTERKVKLMEMLDTCILQVYMYYIMKIF